VAEIPLNLKKMNKEKGKGVVPLFILKPSKKSHLKGENVKFGMRERDGSLPIIMGKGP